MLLLFFANLETVIYLIHRLLCDLLVLKGRLLFVNLHGFYVTRLRRIGSTYTGLFATLGGNKADTGGERLDNTLLR